MSPAELIMLMLPTHAHRSACKFPVKIITGSFKGNLRIYRVNGRDFKPEDLLLEQELQLPILQVAAGRFSS